MVAVAGAPRMSSGQRPQASASSTRVMAAAVASASRREPMMPASMTGRANRGVKLSALPRMRCSTEKNSTSTPTVQTQCRRGQRGDGRRASRTASVMSRYSAPTSTGGQAQACPSQRLSASWNASSTAATTTRTVIRTVHGPAGVRRSRTEPSAAGMSRASACGTWVPQWAQRTMVSGSRAAVLRSARWRAFSRRGRVSSQTRPASAARTISAFTVRAPAPPRARGCSAPARRPPDQR